MEALLDKLKDVIEGVSRRQFLKGAVAGLARYKDAVIAWQAETGEKGLPVDVVLKSVETAIEEVKQKLKDFERSMKDADN